MADWLETYRGVVNPWECDVVQHFTIAYYFDRFADATGNFLDLIGVDNDHNAGVRHGPARGLATFQHELRAGVGFHILTAVAGIDATAEPTRTANAKKPLHTIFMSECSLYA